jgi:hypothetical protein
MNNDTRLPIRMPILAARGSVHAGFLPANRRVS